MQYYCTIVPLQLQYYRSQIHKLSPLVTPSLVMLSGITRFIGNYSPITDACWSKGFWCLWNIMKSYYGLEEKRQSYNFMLVTKTKFTKSSCFWKVIINVPSMNIPMICKFCYYSWVMLTYLKVRRNSNLRNFSLQARKRRSKLVGLFLLSAPSFKTPSWKIIFWLQRSR